MTATMRFRFWIVTIAAVTLGICTAVSAWQQVPARDAASAAVRAGTSSIAGTVVDATSGAAVRRVTVTARDPAVGSRISVTDDEGRFSLKALPAGRYTLTASKPAYVGGAYGLTSAVRIDTASSGTPIDLGESQTIADLSIRITRGAVVSGTVRGTDGRPARGVNVSLVYPMRASLNGERVLSQATLNGSATTDARGEYRMFGVTPGEYILSARLASSGSSMFTPNDLEATTEADLRRIADLNAGRSVLSQTSNASSAETPRRPTYGYASVFYPGTTNLANAAPIALEAGVERTGLDLTLQLVPQSRVTGVVTGLDGRPAANMTLRIVSPSPYAAGPFLTYLLATTGPQGEFTVRAVPAGDYILEVRPGIRGPSSGVLTGWVRSPVSVAPGVDQQVNVTLRPGLTVSGRVSIEADPGMTPPDLSRMRVALTDQVGQGTDASVAADGQFTIVGVVPDTLRLTASWPTMPGGLTWFVKSGTLAGRDAIDATVDLNSSVRDATVVLTTKMAELSGAIVDAAGKPASGHMVVIFPADPSLWAWQTRRLQAQQPSNDGKFTFRNLPPGNYLLGAATDIRLDQWREPAFLTQLSATSVKLTIAEGEKKRQDLQIK
jgi:protocatechuate 3,4-dioxygenase beta subunit